MQTCHFRLGRSLQVSDPKPSHTVSRLALEPIIFRITHPVRHKARRQTRHLTVDVTYAVRQTSCLHEGSAPLTLAQMLTICLSFFIQHSKGQHTRLFTDCRSHRYFCALCHKNSEQKQGHGTCNLGTRR